MRTDAGLSAVAASVMVVAACLPVKTPRPGQTVETTDSRGTVCGHVAVRSGATVVPPLNPGADWAGVGPAVHAELEIHLLSLAPRRVSKPPVIGDGLFCWQLPPGDYLLLGMPAQDASAPTVAQHHWPLAAMRVPGGAVTCAGDLLVETGGNTVVLSGVPRMDFEVAGVEVGDACAERMRQVEQQFAPLSRPSRVQLMVGAADLAFEDPELVAAVRGRLDAAERRGL